MSDKPEFITETIDGESMYNRDIEYISEMIENILISRHCKTIASFSFSIEVTFQFEE